MEREVRELRYWNGNGGAVAIVAVITWNANKVLDWAVYIGAGPTQREADCVAYVAEKGEKMSVTDAKHFAPDLPSLKYRD